MNPLEIRPQVLITLQVALLGMVTSNMRAVAVSWTSAELNVRVIFYSVSFKEFERASEIETELISQFPELKVTCIAVMIGAKERVSIAEGEHLVFRRDPEEE